MLPTFHEWEETHAPAANTQATVTRHAPGESGFRNVCVGVCLTAVNEGAAASGIVTVVLRDGITGTGRIMQTWKLIVPAGDVRGVVDLRRFVGNENTPMTLETTAAPGADVSVAINMTGKTEEIPSWQ
jgi:hypothetical protein